MRRCAALVLLALGVPLFVVIGLGAVAAFSLYGGAGGLGGLEVLIVKMVSLTTNPYVVLLLLNIFFLILGMFLHSAAAIILTVPIVMPLVNQVGIDPIHFGLVLTLNLAIGQQTPPVASVLIAACSIAKSDMWKTTVVNLPFIGVLLILLMMCTYVPAIPMFLVEYFYR